MSCSVARDGEGKERTRLKHGWCLMLRKTESDFSMEFKAECELKTHFNLELNR